MTDEDRDWEFTQNPQYFDNGFADFLLIDCKYLTYKSFSWNNRPYYAALSPLLWGNVAIIMGPWGDRCGYDQQWSFKNLHDATEALNEWEETQFRERVPPGRWIRETFTGRRREYDAEGTLVREYIWP